MVLTLGSTLRLVAILPQEVSEGQKYLSEHGVLVDEVKQSPLNAVGVGGTPTLILTNNEGVVTDAWLGKLSTNKEAEVLGKL